ncbi:MAG: DUF262 domain-containing protein [Candidatus Aenigmarchaeota archaeon]|nr:DUF262 domain-containing protein [Candidatus Aenigmarchaeota archaeon]
MIKNFDSRGYSITDFYKWSKNNELTLNPIFQRRKVWNEKAKSYLIDTIIRGLPISKLYMRESIDISTKKQTREVVDGQQRLNTIFSFIDNGFKIKEEHNKEYRNLYFSELPERVKKDILGYTLSVDIISRTEDAIVLDIFARLNTYGVSLNAQELRNAKYFGFFKQTVYNLAIRYYTFWSENEIFTKNQISRMMEVEFTSDLVVFLKDGIKTRNKKLLDNYYKKYDDKKFKQNKIANQFDTCMDIIGNLYKNSLKSSLFNNKPAFYILFAAIYDLKFNQHSSLVSTNNLPKLKSILDSIEEIIINKSDYEKYSEFIESLKTHTTDKKERGIAFKFVKGFIQKRI